ncbi:T9SS type A sorting domain-containing protein [Halocola ammonii]
MFYRYFLSLGLCCLIASLSFAQQDQNLVPNGHFEDYYMCPDNISQIERLTAWNSWRVTPDYFNVCDSSNYMGVPINEVSFQDARSGSGYAGLIGLTTNNNREILGVELITPLEVGEEYYVEFYWNRAFGGGFHYQCDCASNRLGVLFTNHEYDFIDEEMPVTNNAHLYETELMIDSVNWVKVSGWVEADSTYQYMAIGNFFDADSCETAYLNGNPDMDSFKSYYFIEDVCVATDPAICDLWNKVSEPENESLQIERIGSDQIRLRGLSESSQLTIFDQSGRVLETRTVLPEELINTNHLAAGVYILSVESGESLVTGRFVKY